jgi:hypothetical protein
MDRKMQRVKRMRSVLLMVLCLVALPRESRAERGAVDWDRAAARDAPEPHRATLFDLHSLWRASATTNDGIDPAARVQTRDSLSNGVLIGAIAGAALLGTFGGVICKVQQEEGGPSCVPDLIRIAAIGAGIGAGSGLAIDAALTREPGVTMGLRIRF